MSETVKIHISIEISTEGDYDTGMTVEQWNALTDAERSRIVSDMWSDEAAGHDNGGMKVITEDAEGI
jgi:hypothetical protein